MENGLTVHKVTKQMRLRQWQEIISDRNNSGLTVEEYCNQNGIKKDRYYYWLRKSKEAVIERNPVVFAELGRDMTLKSEEGSGSSITVHINESRIEIHQTLTEALLETVIRIVKNA